MKIKNIGLLSLSSIFLILLFCWWLMTPAKYYIPKNFEKTELEKFSQQWELVDIRGSFPDKRYTRNSLSLPISIYRQLYSEKPYYSFTIEDWIMMLSLIGHYDEALYYINGLQPPTRIDIIKLSFESTYYNNDTSVADFIKNYFEHLKYYKKQYKTEFFKEKEDLKQFVLNAQNDKFPKVHFYRKPVPECTSNRDRTMINGEYVTKCGINNYVVYLIQNGKLDDATSALNKYTKYKSGIFVNNTYLRLGIEYMKKHEYSKAIPLLENVAEFQDYNYKAHEKLVECYRKTGQIQKANYHESIMKELMAL